MGVVLNVLVLSFCVWGGLEFTSGQPAYYDLSRHRWIITQPKSTFVGFESSASRGMDAQPEQRPHEDWLFGHRAGDRVKPEDRTALWSIRHENTVNDRLKSMDTRGHRHLRDWMMGRGYYRDIPRSKKFPKLVPMVGLIKPGTYDGRPL